MSKKLTAMQRAERWYNRQVKNAKLRDSDYSFLSRRMSLMYEPAQLQSQRSESTKHDMLSANKLLNSVKDFKLS